MTFLAMLKALHGATATSPQPIATPEQTNMNYLAMLMALLAQVPTIAAIVHNANPKAPVESKVAAVTQLLTVAGTVASASGTKGTVVSEAIAGASAVLTATVQAIHNAGTVPDAATVAVAPPPVPAAA